MSLPAKEFTTIHIWGSLGGDEMRTLIAHEEVAAFLVANRPAKVKKHISHRLGTIRKQPDDSFEVE